jgi:hypothetical protein
VRVPWREIIAASSDQKATIRSATDFAIDKLIACQRAPDDE